jgi:hypothetical protein
VKTVRTRLNAFGGQVSEGCVSCESVSEYECEWDWPRE